ncbi:hypothetical protein jhhlp_006531 [Lomentospora prolificans]|uniref:Heme haloperoxidase family profile domain-containing protein n=1 Tax=Lomentospora prolificans TaxID=41688 RepID=A0A2N3N658_9PEZI|nr:hypothetical protein jhhlp_006531 [Lomentospora prolificans]
MKLAIAFATFSSALAYLVPRDGAGFSSQWEAPGKNDFRGPCPMMNTLANHKFLPHDGRNLTKEVVVAALARALNFDTALGSLMFDMAIVANPQPNATFFTLRTDAFFGDNHVFNQTVFDSARQYWTKPVIDAQQLANSKLARQIESRAFNPNYTFSAMAEEFSLGEVAAPIIAFGNMETGTVNRTLVEYFFENERLPTELGWSKRNETVTQQGVQSVAEMIRAATSLITGSRETSSETSRKAKIRDLHSGGRA